MNSKGIVGSHLDRILNRLRTLQKVSSLQATHILLKHFIKLAVRNIMKEAEASLQTRGLIVAAVFILLDALLLVLCRNAVPTRDIAVWVGALVLVRLLVNLDLWEGYPVLRSLEDFHKKGRLLEVAVVFGTILIPWLMIGFGVHNAAFLLAPHLFVLQAHIAGEGIVESGQGNKDWFMFVYTCFANAYRVIPLTTWLHRLYDVYYQRDDHEDSKTRFGDIMMVILPVYAIVVWAYWSFWYIPFVWYPFLEKPKTRSTSEGKQA